MNLQTRRAAWISGATVLLFTTSLWAQVTTRPAAATRPAATPAPRGPATDTGPQMGLVKGNNVYVRSGPSTNYYPVTKLNQGHQVTIAGEQFGWLKILPVPGTHSLIDKNYVDRVGAAEKTGILNGSTWVHAGSNIDNRRYAKQVKLARGARVQVLGETSDGAYYKIVPPTGAHLWISGELVDRNGGHARADSPHPPAIEPLARHELETLADETRPKKTSARTAPEPLVAPTGSLVEAGDQYQTLIKAIEAEIAAESDKPVRDRVYEPIVSKLQPLTDQDEDSIARLYAQRRIKQLLDHMGLVAAVQEMRQLRETAVTEADRIRKKREEIMVDVATPFDGIVVTGEIRVSAIYDGAASRPKRWRIVQPGGNNRTLAYIEVPQGSPIDPVQYYGKYIGIRASARHMLRTTIPPLPVYIVEEIVVLDPEAEPWKHSAAGAGVSASPAPPPVAAPSSQPAAEPAAPAWSQDAQE